MYAIYCVKNLTLGFDLLQNQSQLGNVLKEMKNVPPLYLRKDEGRRTRVKLQPLYLREHEGSRKAKHKRSRTRKHKRSRTRKH